jgi:hypothetical protein
MIVYEKHFTAEEWERMLKWGTNGIQIFNTEAVIWLKNNKK